MMSSLTDQELVDSGPGSAICSPLAGWLRTSTVDTLAYGQPAAERSQLMHTHRVVNRKLPLENLFQSFQTFPEEAIKWSF